MQPTTSSLTTVFMGLADAVERQQSPTDVQGLGVLKDHWVSKNHIMVIPGLPSNLSPKPPYPALQVIEDRVHAGWGERVKFGYSRLPERNL